MATKTYYLDQARTEPITVKWGMFYRNFTLAYCGQPVLPTEQGASLTQGGYRYDLPGGRSLRAGLKRSVGMQEVELLLDGQPLSGSATHPVQRIKQAWYTLLLVGLFNILLGGVALATTSPVLQNFGLGWGNAVEGLLFLGLGWLGYQRRSAVLFYVAFGVLIADSVLGLVTLAQAGAHGNFGGFFLRFFICVLVFRGARAAQELRAATADDSLAI